jgi:hypothetical protein
LGRPGPRQSFHAASIISFPFLELLRGGHLARAARRRCVFGDSERWWAHLREAHQAGLFFYAFTALIVAGVKR